jgi:hypothetical protein
MIPIGRRPGKRYTTIWLKEVKTAEPDGPAQPESQIPKFHPAGEIFCKVLVISVTIWYTTRFMLIVLTGIV